MVDLQKKLFKIYLTKLRESKFLNLLNKKKKFLRKCIYL